MGRRRQGLVGARQPPAGKLEPEDPSLAKRAIIEAHEEMDIRVRDLWLAAVVQTRCSRGQPRTIVAFRSTYEGDPVETEEMADPALFPVDALPLDEMHPDAPYWFEDAIRHPPGAPPLSLRIEHCPNGQPIGKSTAPMPPLPRPIH